MLDEHILRKRTDAKEYFHLDTHFMNEMCVKQTFCKHSLNWRIFCKKKKKNKNQEEEEEEELHALHLPLHKQHKRMFI